MSNGIDPSKRPIYVLSRLAVTILAKCLLRVQIVGNENIPREDPLIISSNHIHNFDPFVLGSFVPRYARFMAKSELFRFYIIGKFLMAIGVFPIRRGGQDKAAIREALSIPESGGCLIIFPEGHRSKTGQLGQGQPGVAFIARKSRCVILPAAIIGPYQLFGRLTIRFGKPIHVSANETNEQVLRILMTAIQKLLNEGHAK